ncbi:NADH dehydrogenase [ubiquinone] 1 alpha subcomplex subunit 13 [Anthophora plagiata]
MSKPKIGLQDLPPQGGYPAFPIDRVKLRSYLKAPWVIAGFIAVNIFGFRQYFENRKRLRKEYLAEASAELAAFPIIYAENDRAVLKHMKQVYKLEEEVMKDFPLWETGTFLGIPVYLTLPEDTYVEPDPVSLYPFTSPQEVPLSLQARFLF